MGVNKLIVNDEVKLDLTGDTVAADKMLEGATAHNAAGDLVTGTIPVNPQLSVADGGAVTVPQGYYSGSELIGYLLPIPTAEDAKKVVRVNDSGTGYELVDPSELNGPVGVTETVTGNPAVLHNSLGGKKLQGLKVYGKSTQASNQLLPLTEDTYTIGGLTATLQDDGSLVVNGTPQSVPINLVFFALNLEPGTYYVSGGVPTSGNLYLCVQIASPSGGGFYINQSFTITGNETSVTAMIQNVDQTPLNDYAISPMINRGNSALPIQKYTDTPSPESPMPIVSAGDGGSIHVTLSDGGSQSQTLTLSTPNGLPGIPVTSGGNYTIDGQQYRGNIRDYGAGLDTIAVGRIVLDGTEEWSIQSGQFGASLMEIALPNTNMYNKNGLCSHFDYATENNKYNGIYVYIVENVGAIILGPSLTNQYGSNVETWKTFLQTQFSQGHPVEVLYRLAEPYTQAIPADEMTAYLALTTYEGTTVVSTAEDVAGLEVKYVANAQKYIDNRLTAAESHIQEIAAAQLNAQTGG